MRTVGRPTAISGINPAGSSRVMRLDPLSLPLSFHAHDTRADGGVRRVELHRERVVLVRRDPALNIPLCVSSDHEEIASAWQMWSDILALPLLAEDDHSEPAARRRRHNAIRARRPKFLVRRRAGNPLSELSLHRDEREIIARD